VAAWVSAWAQQHEVSPAIADRLDLCSAEAVTNIVQYAYTASATHEISLRLERDCDRVTLQIEDDGKPFDPVHTDELVPAASLETARIGGWGIPIIRRFSNECHYRRIAGRNVLTLVFRSHPLVSN
jgi:anti-sigma regulatory factor (Ser/Thr protein kinase)